MLIKEVFRLISIWIIVLPFIAGFINYKGLNRDSRWIFLLVVISLPPQLLSFFLPRESALLNILYNLYSLVENLILFFILRKKFKEASHLLIQKILLFLYIAIVLFVFFRNGLEKEFLNSLVSINNTIYMIWILLFLKEQYTAPDTEIRSQNPFAWYLLAYLIYAPCTLIAYALYNYINEAENPAIKNLWIIQSVCNILMYIFFTIGLLLPKQRKTLM